MDRLINDFFTGLVILFVLGCITNVTKYFGEEAVKAHKRGLMNFSNYTKMLTDEK